jgi:hypothetical protein
LSDGVVENLKGHVVLKDTIATFSDLSFSVPATLAHVDGTYGVLTQQVNFHGTLQVDNKLSKGSKGMKSFLLKFAEPFLNKKNAVETVPIKIGGPSVTRLMAGSSPEMNRNEQWPVDPSLTCPSSPSWSSGVTGARLSSPNSEIGFCGNSHFLSLG